MARTQLHLQLAWAVTVHKSQGLKLLRIRLCLGRKEFSSGLRPLDTQAVKFEGLQVHGLLTDLQSFHSYLYNPIRNRLAFNETLLPGFAAHLGWTLGQLEVGNFQCQ
jgi:hypothetical protein